MTKDINVSCGDYFEGRRLYPISLERTHLLECTSCGFATFKELSAWSEKDFKLRIYNDQYHLCDPPFLDSRPRRLATWLAPLTAGQRVLDYGGGEGLLAKLLVEAGVSAYSFDPFYGQTDLPSGVFDIVTAFEVVEHVPDQHALFQALLTLCSPNGLIVFSTLLKDRRTHGDWWYMSPRNGHVCFHSAESIAMLSQRVGLELHSISREMHVAARSPEALQIAKGWSAPPVNERPRYAFVEEWTSLRTLDGSAIEENA